MSIIPLGPPRKKLPKGRYPRPQLVELTDETAIYSDFEDNFATGTEVFYINPETQEVGLIETGSYTTIQGDVINVQEEIVIS